MSRPVEILGFPGAQLLDLCGPLQVFASANDAVKARGASPPYRLKIVAQHSPVKTNSGVSIIAMQLPRSSAGIDTLVVAGGSGVHAACRDAALLRWLRLRAGRARRVVSICTGAFLLGAAGLLEGRRVVTHWSACGDLARRHPSTHVEVDPIFLRDRSVWTSAGVTAGIDLSLALVEEDLGHPLAMAVARDLVVFLKRPGGQAQYSQSLALQASSVQFDELHSWIVEHLNSDLSVASLAAKVTMSERTFVRRYRAATGISPARAVERLRVESAQQMLIDSKLSMKKIARHCGFSSEEVMRQCFQRRAGTSPKEFRARFSRRDGR